MIPAPFAYLRPSTLEEALAALAAQEDAKLLAGGHSLIPAMKLRLAQPRALIDLGRLPELSYIRDEGDALAIGAMTTHYAIESSALLRAKCPLLPEVATHIGDVQVRNRGTLGGSLVHADPAADWPAPILALDAVLVVAGPSGRRRIAATDFFVEMMQSAVQPNEILCEIRVPATSASVAYVKTAQKASGFAVAGVAVVAGLPAGRVRIGITGAAPKPFRALAVEEALAGKTLSAELIAAAALRSDGDVETLNDIHASAEYRAHLIRVNTQRALALALARS